MARRSPPGGAVTKPVANSARRGCPLLLVVCRLTCVTSLVLLGGRRAREASMFRLGVFRGGPLSILGGRR